MCDYMVPLWRQSDKKNDEYVRFYRKTVLNTVNVKMVALNVQIPTYKSGQTSVMKGDGYR